MADWLALHGGDEFTRIFFIVLLIEELKREFVHSNRKHKPSDTTILRVLFYDP